MHVHHTLKLLIVVVFFDVLVAVASLDQALATKSMINLGKLTWERVRADKHVRLIFNNTKFGVKITNTLN